MKIGGKMKRILSAIVITLCVTTLVYAQAEKVARVEDMLAERTKEKVRTEEPAAAPADIQAPQVTQEPVKPEASVSPEYMIGADDMLDISILQPEKLLVTVTVSPDGAITFPYIGTVKIKGMTLAEAQNDIQSRLADGYMKYPVVSIALRQSMSEKFFVYGEVMRPGTYRLEAKMTVLKAISLAGGFTKFGSSSRVKVLRTKESGEGYETIKVNLNAAMNGSSKDDVVLKQGDIVVVSEGIF